ncbi:hypothetical protein CDAR_219641 [Caerostris darwini]|uniref:Uncharacterized protein n=1 Tax=Caerostris darwini TaxID=1538125 RepID=A0AAV4TH72_9ARAC|nr:hypothetical protein CDAR_219641 [Caerostris darwini]
MTVVHFILPQRTSSIKEICAIPLRNFLIYVKEWLQWIVPKQITCPGQKAATPSGEITNRIPQRQNQNRPNESVIECGSARRKGAKETLIPPPTQKKSWPSSSLPSIEKDDSCRGISDAFLLILWTT